MDKKLLYLGGIFGPIAYLLNDIIGGIVTPNYSYITGFNSPTYFISNGCCFWNWNNITLSI